MFEDDFYDVSYRDFSDLVPTDRIAAWSTQNDRGYSTSWVTRIVYQEDSDGDLGEPIVEFYSTGSGTGQFVAAYYIATLLGEDGFGSGKGGLDLMGYEPHWKICSEHMDSIRKWLAEQAIQVESARKLSELDY